jgi:hypothetical protein
VGFTNRYDTNYAGSYIQYETDRDAKKAIVSKRVWNETNISYDWKGRSQYFITNTRGQLALQRQTFVGANLQWGFERVYENEFGPIRSPFQNGAFAGTSGERGAKFTALQSFIESTPTKQWYIFAFMDYTWGIMEYDFGASPDYPRVSQAYVDYRDQCAASPELCLPHPPKPPVIQVPGLDPGPGDQLTIESQIRYQPTTAFQTQLNFTKRRLVRHDTGLVAVRRQSIQLAIGVSVYERYFCSSASRLFNVESTRTSAVRIGLDAESRDGALCWIQRRHRVQQLQSVHPSGRAGVGIPQQRPHLLHKGIVSFPEKLLSNLLRDCAALLIDLLCGCAAR